MNEDIKNYIAAHAREAYELLLSLARIPAPSNHEEKRAAFCLDWLKENGAEDAYIDEAQNVIYPVGNCDGEVTVYMAHSDVVFPDTEELPLVIENGRIYCPGAGDDSANAVALLTVMKYIAQSGKKPKDQGLLLVINSGEEGLGNLRGSRAIVDRYGDRIREFITFDGNDDTISGEAVGSLRYRVTADTEGGHSWHKFGAKNAIAELSMLIGALYELPLPSEGKTTYNVGKIEGGTSVNTVAQYAEMLWEFRSTRPESLKMMHALFEAEIAKRDREGVCIKAELIAERPCGAVRDVNAHEALMVRASEAMEKHFGNKVKRLAKSTDCNIPLSCGIPSVCIATVKGGGAHTREEYVELDSLVPGISVAFEMIVYHLF